MGQGISDKTTREIELERLVESQQLSINSLLVQVGQLLQTIESLRNPPLPLGGPALVPPWNPWGTAVPGWTWPGGTITCNVAV